jgi:hypothetical protein
MTSPDTGRAGEVRAVRTNGIGKRTTAHLNLTRSLADPPSKPTAIERARQRAAMSEAAYVETFGNTDRIKFAGAE